MVYGLVVYNILCTPCLVEDNPGNCRLASVPGTTSGLKQFYLSRRDFL